MNQQLKVWAILKCGLCDVVSMGEKFLIFSFSHYLIFNIIGESSKGRMADALAHGGDEGRDKLR